MASERPRPTRLFILAAVATASIAAAPAAHGRAATDVPRVRPADPLAREVLETAAASSPTVAALITALQQCDVIVIVGTGALPLRNVNGVAFMLASTPSVRYIRVILRIPNHLLDLMRLLGHELQHALEIALMPDLYDGICISSAYRRPGVWMVGTNRYETEAAVRTGKLVAWELRSRLQAP